MTKSLRLAIILASVGSALAAQSQSVYFSTRYTETPASGRAGFLLSGTAGCNPPSLNQNGGSVIVESGVMNSPGVAFVEPGVLNSYIPAPAPPNTLTTDFVEVANFPQFNLMIGDLDADGIPDEVANFAGIDALYIPFAATGRRNNIHEMFVSSFSDHPSAGAGGYYGTGITEADMVLYPAATNIYPAPHTPQPPVFFVRQTDWEAFFGIATNNTLDVDAFAVDAVGNLYVSFDGSASYSIQGALLKTTAAGVAAPTAITRGDIIRIPAAAYTPSGPYGVVSSPLPGFAERILSAAEVTTLVGFIGGTITVNPVNVYGLDIDPIGTTTTSATTGFVYPDLLFTIDALRDLTSLPQNLSATSVYTTALAGSFAIINGVLLNQPNSLGINNLNFDATRWSGPLDALDVIQHTPTLDPFADRPLHLDTFPTNGSLTNLSWTGTFTGYLSGAAPGATLAVFASLEFVPTGGSVQRWSVSSYVPGFPDLYVDVFGYANPTCLIAPASVPFPPYCQVPYLQSLLSGGNNPIPIWTDPINGASNGDTCFNLNLTTILPAGSPPFSPPPLIVFQVLDLASAKLSSPLSFQLN